METCKTCKLREIAGEESDSKAHCDFILVHPCKIGLDIERTREDDRSSPHHQREKDEMLVCRG